MSLLMEEDLQKEIEELKEEIHHLIYLSNLDNVVKTKQLKEIKRLNDEVASLREAGGMDVSETIEAAYHEGYGDGWSDAVAGENEAARRRAWLRSQARDALHGKNDADRRK